MLPLPVGEVGGGRMVRVEWKYLNGYGNVPERDDVRFDLAIKEAPIPRDWAIPRHADYAGMVEAGLGHCDADRECVICRVHPVERPNAGDRTAPIPD